MTKFVTQICAFLLAISSPYSQTLASPTECDKSFTESSPLRWLDYSAEGISAASFFNSTTHMIKGKPRTRFVIVSGLPGSGKTSWIEHAKENRWNIVDVEQIKVDILQKKARASEHINVGKNIELADPTNPTHLFLVSALAFQIANVRLQSFLKLDKPIIFDALNLGIQRTQFVMMARNHGYATEALFFETKDVRINANNILHRAQSGGLDLAYLSIDPETASKERIRVLQSLKSGWIPFIVKPFDTNNVSVNERLPRLVRTRTQHEVNNFVNRITKVDVKDWSKFTFNQDVTLSVSRRIIAGFDNLPSLEFKLKGFTEIHRQYNELRSILGFRPIIIKSLRLPLLSQQQVAYLTEKLKRDDYNKKMRGLLNRLRLDMPSLVFRLAPTNKHRYIDPGLPLHLSVTEDIKKILRTHLAQTFDIDPQFFDNDFVLHMVLD